ncbi:biotin-dependent carboxyltransferase family protein [Alkalihalobacillus sp. MEB130]|uniref:5-oxoprolinase subunit C family protein n=1 Tax=Alkalihalobacillus sp. MEB130 TaxID=2976704 RepID=UPI0028DF1680|nr:biotin-dependent carboxyltransferase family protein [Alkalihalobacillus sp. MEB130]MDT8862424.1 biotin-dependent carboxyltransferase family protein [Alkalihalobacillus sp. MEB130]
MEFVKVIKPGLLTTIQDLGRPQQRVFGVSASGAMDSFSFRIANILAGNEENTAALEVTLVGPHLVFQQEGVMVITGGNLSPSLNNKPISMWKAIRIKKGDELTFGRCLDGCRSYIAFSGGIDVPEVMGSRSTYIRGNYGGFEGRALKAGDLLMIGKPQFNHTVLNGRRLRPIDTPDFKTNRPVRIILGPHDQEFTKDSLTHFLTEEYSLSNDSDRMGYRLMGPQLKHINGPDIISDFISMGTIQVPGNGYPIIHMADCGTSGGYTKIGVVITADLSFLGQRKPGDKIDFQPINIEEAHHELRIQETLLSELSLINDMTVKLS